MNIEKLKNELTLARSRAVEEIENLEKRLEFLQTQKDSFSRLLGLCETMSDTSEMIKQLLASCGMTLRPDAISFSDSKHIGATFLPTDPNRRKTVGDQLGMKDWDTQ